MSARWQPRARRQVGHMDDWLMTYADMITLLLCFFVVLVPSVIAAQKAKPTSLRAPVEAQDVMPKESELQIDVPDAPASSWRDPMAQQAAPQKPEPPKTEPVKVEVQAPASTVAEKPKDEPHISFSDIVETVQKGDAPQPAALEEKGDRLTTIDISSAAFFAQGSSTLSDEGKALLLSVAENLKSEKYRNYQITVEGHTDDAPIKTPLFPSNWELSTARASAVVQFLIAQAIPPQKLRAAGYADTFPKAPNRDASGNPLPANQAQNRRVVIKLEKLSPGVAPGP